MFNLLIVTPYNFNQATGGAVNRVIGFARAISEIANVIVLHQGSNIMIDNVKFFHYDTLLKYDSSVKNVINLYASFNTSSITHKIRSIALTEEIDVIQVEQPYPFIPSLKARNSINKNIILSIDEHNVDFLTAYSKLRGNLLNTIYTSLTLPLIWNLEKYAVNKSDILFCVSQKDIIKLCKLYKISNEDIYVFPNGVNIKNFENAPVFTNYKELYNKTVLFHGSLNWFPNIEAVDYILNYIAPKIPKVTFLICGPNPSKFFLKQISKAKNVKYLGYVDRLESLIKSVDLCISPILRGGGTKLKLLEYAAAGKPIIATEKSAEGLPFIHNKNALLFKKIDEQFINAIKNILLNENQGITMGSNAKNMVQNFDWKIISEKISKIYMSKIINK